MLFQEMRLFVYFFSLLSRRKAPERSRSQTFLKSKTADTKELYDLLSGLYDNSGNNRNRARLHETAVN